MNVLIEPILHFSDIESFVENINLTNIDVILKTIETIAVVLIEKNISAIFHDPENRAFYTPLSVLYVSMMILVFAEDRDTFNEVFFGGALKALNKAMNDRHKDTSI